MNYNEISKEVSYALRHAPWEYELEMDEEGWVSVSQLINLSQDIETASQVGKRRDEQPVILLIDAENAHKQGIKFYHGNEKVWLADFITTKYISKI